MIKHVLAGLASALCLSAPALAQTFSHTHGTKGYHGHDITTYTVTGACCCCCGAETATELLNPSHQTNRTYVRRYTHPTVERRTYTRVIEPHTSYHASREHHHEHSQVVHHEAHSYHAAPILTHDERRERDYALAGQGHTDRAHAWAHYDRKWRSRTNDKRH